eukprot:COSAG02_NODE_12669_length_1511_cov_20.361898_1_plen_259_part_00
MEAENGIPGLQVVDAGTENYAQRAAQLFERDGFVCVRGVLSAEHVAALRERTDACMRSALRLDKYGGSKGAWRFMFSTGERSGTCMHYPEYAKLVEAPAVDEILTEIWKSPDFRCHAGGGDFSFPGAEYQPLHSDHAICPSKVAYDAEGLVVDHVHALAPEEPGFTYVRNGGFLDPSKKLDMRDLPCPSINVNFLPRDFTRTNGPTRFIPGSHRSRAPIPALAEEPAWMRYSTVCPLPAGSAVFRDERTCESYTCTRS